jgi:hypothetical protein
MKHIIGDGTEDWRRCCLLLQEKSSRVLLIEQSAQCLPMIWRMDVPAMPMLDKSTSVALDWSKANCRDDMQ